MFRGASDARGALPGGWIDAQPRDPHGVIDDIDGRSLMQAMHGDLMITLRLTEVGQPASDPEWTLGEGGRLADVGRVPDARAGSGCARLP